VELNEIASFISGRLLSASEAAWRLLSLQLHQEFPAVCRLDVLHLPCHQMMVFDPTADPRDILDAASRQSSTLLEWFALNRRDPRARQYKCYTSTFKYRNIIVSKTTVGLSVKNPLLPWATCTAYLTKMRSCLHSAACWIASLAPSHLKT
jgi:hypothetical protein